MGLQFYNITYSFIPKNKNGSWQKTRFLIKEAFILTDNLYISSYVFQPCGAFFQPRISILPDCRFYAMFEKSRFRSLPYETI